MADQMENPFSKEKAWATYRENMRVAARIKAELENPDCLWSEREKLFQAVEAVGRLTDNTVLARIVRQAVEARDAE